MEKCDTRSWKPVEAKLVSNLDGLLSEKPKEALLSSTFTFVEVKPGELKTRPEGSDWESETVEYSSLSSQIGTNQKLLLDGDRIHFASDHRDSIRAPFSHGLLGTMYKAYSQHIPLILRPDDLWISICVAFGKYVTKHAHEMRSCFVDHQGRKELAFKVWSPLMAFTTEEHWCGFLGELEKEIVKNVKGDLVNWMVPNFTTTTHRDRVVGTVALMGALKEYFSYKGYLCCGLTKVTLMGSLDDWTSLVERAKHLYTFNQPALTAWADLLIPVLENFVSAYRGNVDSDFWQRICTYKPIGSGGDKKFRGWFLVFAPFDENGRYILRPKEQVIQDHIYADILDSSITDCIVECPMTIEDHTPECGMEFARAGGKRYEVKLVAGLLVSRYNQNANTLQPSVDWAMIIKKEMKFEDMQQALKKRWGEWSEKDKIAGAEKLLPFAHYAANAFGFPNDSLLDVAYAVYGYWSTWCMSWTPPWQLKTDAEVQKGFLIYIVSGHHEGRSFRNYIDPRKIDVVIAGYK